jgi:hypothetical protein
LTAGVLATLAALSDIEVTGGIATSVWARESTSSDATFYRHRKMLLTLGLVSNVGTEKQARYQVTDDGTLALSQNSHESP